MLDKDVALVVDDSATARTTIVQVLRDRLYCRTVFEASNGQEALRLLKKHPEIDWIFCDWEMPVMSGDELLIEVRNDPRTAHLPFIMITSHSDRDSLVTAVQLGVTSFIVKPFSAKKLVEKVFLARGRMERRNAERIKAGQGQKVSLLFFGGKQVEASLIDISLSGMLMSVSHDDVREYTVFDELQARLVVTDTLILPCQIIRLEADPTHPARDDRIRLAVRFQPMPQDMGAALLRYIEQLSRKDSLQSG